ncbi:uncharacterized protein LOC141790100 [Halichoeres trimaculatus]|uniref:uncharacterized protein LOC141790100 n=1 Tax=Halichoeres trimaculatus TaxID=147232 RepID=UPI003D9DF45D
MSDKPRGVGGNSKKKRGKEEEEMTFGLLECLRAVGLQHHYARFSSVGIDRAAHLSVLTMEDYPILGIHSMEDRTRLFQLIQMVKTLDLKSLEHEDEDVYSADAVFDDLSFVHLSLKHKFFFDQVFGEESSNEEVYQRTAYPLVQHMLNGGKATCFAYGQTGSGKTHTMLGSSPRSPGLYALAVRDIFAHLSSTHMNSPLLVYVSFFEIYCGQLYDLLDHRKRLYAREDGQKVVHIAGMRDVRVDSVSSLLEVIAQGTEERTQGVSGVNPHSSRSHALLQIQLRDTNQQLAGRIWFVDLAGSERASDTKEPDRQSRMEGAEINQSLLALKECIRSLDQEQLHTPFRQSKLTQVLKDSFVGDSMTCMIANISPGHLASEHTLNTLRYADRVKELQGQGGLKRGRRGKLFPKCNVSKSSRRSSSSSQGSSVFMRGKSPPKKPKFGTSREAFIPTMRTMRLATGGPILCSTPKNCKQDEKTSTRDRRDIGLEQVTPVKGVIRIGDNRKIATVRDRRIESDVGIDGASHLSGDQNIRESEIFCKEWGNQSKEGREQERRQIEEKRQTQGSRDSYTGVERVKERDLGKEYGRDREKETHLRWYHQQLQQFTPSSVFSDSTCLSESSSHPASLSSSVFSSSVLSFQHSPHLSDSALTYQGLEDSSDDYIATVTVKAVVPLTSQHCNKDKDKVSHGDSGGRDVGSSREERRPAGLEGMRGRGWAWLPGCMTGVRPAAKEAQVSYNCDSEQRREVGEGGSESSDVSAEGVWSNEEHESNDSCGYSTRPVVEMSNHRAPAERPLSPGCEHAITSLTPNKPSELPFRSNHIRWTSRDLHPSTQSSVTAEPSRSKEDLLFAADANKRQLSNAALPPEDSFNCIMEPLSISLLQVDQQAATTSFLQGASKGSSPCPLGNEVRKCSRRVNVHAACLDRAIRVGGEGEFGLSLLEMPQVKTHCPPISNPITSSTTEGRQEISGTTNGLHGLGTMTLPIPENKLDSLRDQKIYQKTPTGLFIENLPNNTSAAPVKLSLCALSKRTSVIQPTSSSTQPHKNKDTGNSHNAEKNGGTQILSQHVHNKHPLPFSLTATKAVLGQMKMLPKQGATVHSIPSDNSDILPQPNDWTSLKFQGDPSNQTTRNIINPPLEDLDHAKWHVIQAHWKQLEDMEALWHKEGTLLCQQPDMAFSEYIHKLEEIMKKKAQCVHSMIAQLQPYLRSHHSNQAHTHNQEVDHHENTCIN